MEESVKLTLKRYHQLLAFEEAYIADEYIYDYDSWDGKRIILCKHKRDELIDGFKENMYSLEKENKLLEKEKKFLGELNTSLEDKYNKLLRGLTEKRNNLRESKTIVLKQPFWAQELLHGANLMFYNVLSFVCVLFISLKLIGVLNWNWFMILHPLWIGALFLFFKVAANDVYDTIHQPTDNGN